MTTPDYPDWTTPNVAVDISTRIPGSPFVLAPPAQVPVFDTSRYASLILTVTPPNTGTGQRYVLAVQWFEGAEPADADVLSYNDSFSWQSGDTQLLWQVPVRGTSAIVEILEGSNSATSSIDVVGSTRTLSGPSVAGDRTNRGRLLLDTGNVNIAAGGASARFFFPPVARAVAVWFWGNGNAGHVDLYGISARAAAIGSKLRGTYSVATTAISADDVPLPGIGGELVMNNDTAAAHNYVCRVWDVS